MKQWWLMAGKGCGVLLLILVSYRLGVKVFQPDNLFFLTNFCFVLALAGWALHTASLAFRAGPNRAGQARLLEFQALTGMSVLTMAAFVLAAHGLRLAGRPAPAAIPWLPLTGPFSEPLAAAGLFLLLIWLFHPLLCRLAPRRNPALFPLAAMLAGIGLVLLYRLGPDIAAKRDSAGFTLLFWSQFQSLAVSLLIFAISLYYFSAARLESLTRKRYVYGLACVAAITVTALLGTEMHGRRLSLNLGIMNFQTVELVKVLALFFMVGYFRFEGGFLEPGKGVLGLPRGRYLAPYVFMWFLILLPIFLQKDLGPTALLFALFLVVFYLGTGSGSSVLTGLALMTGAGVVAYTTGFPSMARTRIDMWLDPFHYSQNLAEALWAAGSGGLAGTGPGLGLPWRIPVVWSDFNFVVIAEEWGFIGAAAVLVLFGALVAAGLRTAMEQREPYRQLLAAGLAALWMLQTMVIVGGNLALLPLTGITLPFISFGGSSLVMNFVMLAMMVRVSGEEG